MPARLDEVFARHKPRAIIHMAGYAEVGKSVRQPERYMHNNVTKTGVLVEAALRHGIEAFVFSSTCSVYGLPQSDLLDEKHPIAPMSPYAESKARVEVLLAAAATRGLRAASLRYFNAAGADAGGEIGEAHSPETHLLPLAADAVLGFGPPLTLLGDDYPTPDGSLRARLRPCDRFGRCPCPRASAGSRSSRGRACTKSSTSAAAPATACAR